MLCLIGQATNKEYIHIFVNRDSCPFKTLRMFLSEQQCRIRISVAKGSKRDSIDACRTLEASGTCLDSIEILPLKLSKQRNLLNKGSIDLVFRTAKLYEADFSLSDSTYVKLLGIDSADVRQMKDDIYYPDTIPSNCSYNTPAPVWSAYMYPTVITYTVKEDDKLWLIASRGYIYADSRRWPEIYAANKDKIKDPDSIYPEQEFLIVFSEDSIPNLIGLNFEEAKTLVKSRKLLIGNISYRKTVEFPEGIVIDQYPLSMQGEIVENSPINLVISQ